MGLCLRLVEECDIVVFSRLLGKITAGVGKEVNHAMKNGKAVYEITQVGTCAPTPSSKISHASCNYTAIRHLET